LDFARREKLAGTFSTAGMAAVAEGSFPVATDWLEARFEKAAAGRYLCVEVLSSHEPKPVAALAEIDAVDAAGQPVAKAAWKILWASSEELVDFAGEADNVLDGQTSSSWHSAVAPTQAEPPHRLVIDLGARTMIGGVRLLPRAGKPEAAGRIKDYKTYLSDTPFGLVPR